MGEELECFHVGGVSGGGSGEALFHEKGGEAEEGAIFVEKVGEVFLGGVGPGAGGICLVGGFELGGLFLNAGDLGFGLEVDFAIERFAEGEEGIEFLAFRGLTAGEGKLALDLGEGGGDGGDGGVEFAGVSLGGLAECCVELGEGFDFSLEHFDFGGVFFVVGLDEGVDACALSLEFFGEEVGPVVGVGVLVIEKLGEAFFVGGAGFFESGGVDVLGRFAIELEGAVGGLALLRVLILHPLKCLADGHGWDGGVILGREISGEKSGAEEGEESHECLKN